MTIEVVEPTVIYRRNYNSRGAYLAQVKWMLDNGWRLAHMGNKWAILYQFSGGENGSTNK